jgi:hypothetical protein
MKKLVCVTPAGRRRYMKNLIPQILSSDIVFRYDIWINTTNVDDINFFEFLDKKFEKINLIYQPEGIVDGNKSINAFFKTSMSEDEVYVRLDDDIMWIIPGFFDEIYQKRIEDNDSFLISPLVINNSISTHIFQQKNKYQFDSYLPALCMNDLTWSNPRFAYNLHLWFLNHLENKTYNNIKTEDYYIALNRFSINSIAWHGSDFKLFDAEVKGDEEEYLTVIKPAELKKVNKIIGSLLVAHYSFFPQRDYLDKTDLLNRYENAVRESYSSNLLAVEIFSEIDKYFLKIDQLPIPKLNQIGKLKNLLASVKVPVIKFKRLSDIL